MAERGVTKLLRALQCKDMIFLAGEANVASWASRNETKRALLFMPDLESEKGKRNKKLGRTSTSEFIQNAA